MDRLKDAMLAWPVGTRVRCGVAEDAPSGSVTGHDEDRIGVYVEVRLDKPRPGLGREVAQKWHKDHLYAEARQ